MADNDYSVNIDLSSKGLSTVLASLEKVQGLLDRIQSGNADDLQKAFGGISQELQKATGELQKFGQAAGLKGMSSDLKGVHKQVQELEAAFQKANEASFLSGKGGRGTDTARGFSDEQRRLVQEFKDLQGATLAKASAEVARQKDAVAAAQERVNKTLERAAQLEQQDTMGRRAAAAEQASRATKELADATANLNRVSASAPNTTEHAQALNRYDAALKGNIAAQREANAAGQEFMATLPRMRYAMYDVAQSATILGAAFSGIAVGAGAAFASFESQFINVIRTTETYLDSTGAATQNLESQFRELFATMPQDWAEFTNIGTMAGQMAIAADDVGRFTGLVSQFAITANMDVNEATTAFGRLSALLGVASSEYENLGSAILQTGLNSVATDAEIVKTTQEIAGIGSTAGLSAEEVIGLSAAMASIGTKPELARGSITRMFTNIMSAVSDGGDSLEAFGRLAGVSAEQFAQTWNDEPIKAVEALMAGLSRLSDNDAVQALHDIGVKSVRDVPAILKLSQNTDILARSLDSAAEGYRNGTMLSEQYSVFTDTLTAKLTVLKNNVQLLAATFGQGAAVLKPFIEGLSNLIANLTAIVDTPVGQVLSNIALVITGVVGAVGLFVAGLAGAVASGAALKTAMFGVAQSFGWVSSSAQLASMSMRQLGAVMVENTMKANVLSGALSKTRLFGWLGRLTTGGLLGGIGVGLAAVTIGVELLGKHLRGADGAAEQLYGSMDNLRSAIQQDTDAFNAAVDAARENGEKIGNTTEDLQAFAEGSGAAFRVMSVAMEDTGGSSDVAAEALNNIVGISSDTAAGLDGVTESAERATIALGENLAMALTTAMVNNDDFMAKLKEAAVGLDEVGFSVGEYTEAMLSGRSDEYLTQLETRMKQMANAMRESTDMMDTAAAATVEREIITKFGPAQQMIDSLRGSASDLGSELNDITWKAQVAGAAAEYFGVSVDGTDESLEGATERARDFAGALDEMTLGTANSLDAVASLAETLIENGNAFDVYSASGRENMLALDNTLAQLWQNAGQNTEAYGMELINMMAYMEGAGVDLGDQLFVLQDQLLAVFNGPAWNLNLSTAQARQSIHAFIEDAIKALQAVAQMEKRKYDALSKPQNITANIGTAGFATVDKIASGSAYNEVQDQIKGLRDLQGQLGKVADEGAKAGNAIRDSMRKAGGGGRSAGNAAKKAGDQAKKAAKEVRTLVDYASDLSSVWNRAFDIRFSGQSTLDSVSTATQAIRDRFREAAERVKDLRLEIRTLRSDITGLQAEKSQQEYFLKVATDYGDTARAEQIQARLAEIAAQLANKQNEVSKTTKEMEKAQQDSSRSLTGNSEAAIRNRGDLEALVREYAKHLEALAASGMSSADLQKEAEKLRRKFIEEATQLGYNRSELKKYEGAFKDIITTIGKVPRNVTIKANANPAIQAFNEFKAKATARVNDVAKKLSDFGKKKYSGPSIGAPRISGGANWDAILKSMVASYAASNDFRQAVAAALRAGRGTQSRAAVERNLLNSYRAQTRRTLGFNQGGEVPTYATHGTSPHPSDTIPAWLTPGEWVIPKRAVDYYGSSMMRAIQTLKMPKTFYSAPAKTSRSAPSNSVSVVDLSAGSIQAIAHAVQPYLVVGDRTIAGAANRYATSGTQLGRG